MPLTIIPSIDLREGKVVRLQQGDFSRQIEYQLDPIELARSFARDGATLMHVVDLDGAKAGCVTQHQLIADIVASANIPVQAGGGVRSEPDIYALLHDAKVSRVVVGTRAIEDWDWFDRVIGKGQAFCKFLVLAIDARDGMVATRGWTNTSSVSAVEIAARVRNSGLGALLYTDVAKDGMLSGPNIDMTEKLTRYTDVPVIASGGVGTLDHIRALKGRNIAGVILGRALHDGKIKLKEAIEVAGE